MLSKIKLQFLGAYAGVTGSKSLLEWKNQRYLIDCGLFQGPSEVRQQNWADFPINASSIDAVFLTHAHLDHVGYLPRLYKQGFRGPVYCSEGTQDLAEIILLDSAHLEEESAAYANETKYSYHEKPLPLFTIKDAEDVLKLFRPIPRYEWYKVSDDVSIRLLRAGHIIGASMVQVMVTQESKSKVFSFSGDIGHDKSMILKGPDAMPETDVLILESTYGDRLHAHEDACETLGNFLKKAIDRSGVVVIPAFAVGRSQELIYMIGQLERRGIIPSVPVILDSPMSEKALKIFFCHEEDQLVTNAFQKNPDGFFPQKFETSPSPDQSMLVTMMDGPAIVISASGMLSGGRILHHLKHRLPHPNNMVIFSGYQAEGTKGRFLQDNSASMKTLRIHHQEVELHAEVVTIGNLSAHADYEQMLSWLKKFSKKPQQVLVNHGNPEAQIAWAHRLEKELGWTAKASFEKDTWEF